MIISFTKEEQNSIYEALHKYYEDDTCDQETIAFRREIFKRIITYFVPPHNDVNLDLSKKELGFLKETLVYLDPPNNDLRRRITDAHRSAPLYTE